MASTRAPGRRATSWLIATAIVALAALVGNVVLLVGHRGISSRLDHANAARDAQAEAMAALTARVDDQDSTLATWLKPPPLLTAPTPAGVLTYQFAKEFAVTEATIRRDIIPAIEKYAGPPWHSATVVVTVDPAVTQFSGRASCVEYSPNQTTLRVIVRSASDFAVIAHELAHAFHGCYGINNSGYEEGYAEAVSKLVMTDTGTSQFSYWFCRLNYDALNQDALSGGQQFRFSTASDIMLLRYALASDAFFRFERKNPGFLERFGSELYTDYRRGFAPSAVDIVGAAERAQSGFTAYIETQLVFAPRPARPTLGIVPCVNGIVTFLAIGRDNDGVETLLTNVTVDVTITQGGSVKRTSVTTSPSQRATIDLVQLGSNISQPLTIEASAGSLSNRVTVQP